MRAFARTAMTAIAIITASPAFAQGAAPAAAIDQSSPASFIQSLADKTFAVLRDGGMDKDARRERFRTLVREHFAIKQIGDRLIRRYRPTITPAQYQAYNATLPGFIVGAYADRLQAYQDAKFQVLRTVPNGNSAEVFTRVTQAGQSRPIQATWTLTKDTAGNWRIANLTVEGVNLLLSQEADFSSMIDRQGFDALVAFMRSRSAS